MSELTGSRPPRRRRADAERSITAILDAATRVLGQRPQAGIKEIAEAAGISRQTVYAHFPSREDLLAALVERATGRVVAALDAAELDQGSATDALVRLLEISWQIFGAEPFLLHPPDPRPSPGQERDQHGPVLRQLDRLVRRGQREGDFDPELPVSWILAAIIALGHATGEEVRAGRMTADQAAAVLRNGVPRLFQKSADRPDDTDT